MTRKQRDPRATELGLPGGRLYDYTRPNPEVLEIEDIALGLANTARFAGHTERMYSVAEHSVHVMHCAAEIAANMPDPPDSDGMLAVRRHALMHDSAEAVLGDVTTPLKRAIGKTWYDLEAKNEVAILRRFRVVPAPTTRWIVHWADRMVYHAEARAMIPDAYWVRDEWTRWQRFSRWASPRKRFLQECERLGIW